jgi:hypothetical protein
VVYLGAWPIWRWCFLPDFPLEKETPLEILLNGVCRYLSEPDTVQFRLETDAPAYLSGEPVRLKLFARRPDGTPWQGLDVRFNLNAEAQAKSLVPAVPMLEKGEGRYEAQINGLLPGEHYADLIVRDGDKIVGRAKVGFSVLEQSREQLRLGLNRGLLVRLAEVSGGWFVRAESLSSGHIAQITPRVYERQIVLDPRRLPWWFGLIAVLYSLELVLRRKRGLY